MSTYNHTPHPHTTSRLSGESAGPVKVDDGRVGLNGRIGLRLTALVGTMVCAYVFGAIALISLPSAIHSHNPTILIAWISSNFLQLVLLPVIIVGQNLQARAARTSVRCRRIKMRRRCCTRRSRSRSTWRARTRSSPS